ncbi:hypothetical protein BD410DRAFT_795984 [Rickenella mellea]|uniref:Uncharacterized protein n=1 Tax=Rickenella mellea TaxID=50990 RepID=A0A4Y7PLX6_9AGAM|nr:hypothetical protein BD410DRAFT_795984 [Rickenella mellea]
MYTVTTLLEYVLQLQARFPLRASKANNTKEFDRWKERAFILESELEVLKKRFEVNSAELQILQATSTAQNDSRVQPQCANQSVAPKKKKRKVAQEESNQSNAMDALLGRRTRPQDVLGIDTVAKGFGIELFSHPRESMNMLSAYRKLLLLRESNPDTHSMKHSNPCDSSHSTFRNAIVLAATDLVQASGSVLSFMISRKFSTEDTEEVFQTMDDTLCSAVESVNSAWMTRTKFNIKETSTLETADPARDSYISAFLSSLLNNFITPLLGSFMPLSVHLISSRLSPAQTAKHVATPHDRDSEGRIVISDPRPMIYASLRKITMSLHENSHKNPLCLQLKGVEDFIVMAAAKETRRLWHLPEVSSNRPITRSTEADLQHDHVAESNPSRRSLTRSERMHLLARKDALWYLCAMMQDISLSSRSQPSASNTSTMVQALITDKARDVLSDLLNISISLNLDTTSAHGDNISEVERCMILATIERLWMAEMEIS